MSEEKRPPTPEEIKAYRENMIKYYTDELPLLKKRKEYETLVADISEQKARAATMYARMAQIMNPPELNEPEEIEKKVERPTAEQQTESPVETLEVKDKKRTLKTEEK